MIERFLLLHELAPALRKSREHLTKIAQAQNGIFRRPRFSQQNLATYPRFVKGPGNKYGCGSRAYEDFRREQARLGRFVPPSVNEIVHINVHA